MRWMSRFLQEGGSPWHASADAVGLSAAQRSVVTEVWDGPSPMLLWIAEDAGWPDDPGPTGWQWWMETIRNQESLARSPRAFDRVFYWLTIKHYLLWWVVSTVGFWSLLITSLRTDPLTILSVVWSLVIALNTAMMILRAIARRPLILGKPSGEG
jgi:hypothetical protein